MLKYTFLFFFCQISFFSKLFPKHCQIVNPNQKLNKLTQYKIILILQNLFTEHTSMYANEKYGAKLRFSKDLNLRMK